MDHTLNIFVIETELQYLAYLAIKEYVSSNMPTLVFTTSDRVYARLNSDGVDCDLVIKESRGWVGRMIRLRRNLALYKNRIDQKGLNFSEINFHVPRIDTLLNNIAINYFRNHYNYAHLNVRLIPDGAINIFSCDLSESKKRKQKRWLSDFGFKFFADMNYYSYSGDELGADADAVDRIYCFQGVETNYPDEKKCQIELPITASIEKKEAESVLVVGQNFLQLGTASESYIDTVSVAVLNLVSEFSSGQADYAPHPRSQYNEFRMDDYSVIEHNYLCVEELIAEGNYKHIISCYSSVLINSKIMYGDSINTYSVGINKFPFPDKNQAKILTDAYKNIGVKVIDI
jgi:hypothetical protein